MKGWLIILILVLPSLAFADKFKNDTRTSVNKVTVCVTNDDWPPYIHSKNNNQGKLYGASVDSIDFLFKKLKLDYDIKPIVWARLINFRHRLFLSCDLVWGVNKSRADSYNLKISKPLYATQIIAFYDKKTFNEKNVTKISPEYLLKQKNNICGIRGYDYRAINSLVKIRVNDNQQALDLLARSRCSLFFTGAEVAKYSIEQGIYKLSSNVAYANVHNQKTYYYAAMVQQDKRALNLLKNINQVIEYAVKSGEWQVFYKKYGIHHGLNI